MRGFHALGRLVTNRTEADPRALLVPNSYCCDFLSLTSGCFEAMFRAPVGRQSSHPGLSRHRSPTHLWLSQSANLLGRGRARFLPGGAMVAGCSKMHAAWETICAGTVVIEDRSVRGKDAAIALGRQF